MVPLFETCFSVKKRLKSLKELLVLENCVCVERSGDVMTEGVFVLYGGDKLRR